YYSTSSSQTHFVEHVSLFIFGDSLFDPGNNNYINTTPEFQANFWPYGISYFDPPTGRFSDGRLIPDFIAEYAGLPLIPTYLDPSNNEFVYGANFASGGAGALVETHAGFVVDLKTQLEYFGDLEKQLRQDLGDTKTDKLISEAVYLFSCGGNDYLSPVGNNDSVLYPYTHEQYKLKELEEELEGFMYSLFDLNTEVSHRMKNPSKYGNETVHVVVVVLLEAFPAVEARGE
ncbi:hypothetical protein M8C21_012782, partial [Ambrosia artemisiifolia]